MKDRNSNNEIKGDIGFIDEMLDFLADHRIDCVTQMLEDWKDELVEIKGTAREGK